MKIKKDKRRSPTALTPKSKSWLETRGYIVEKCEFWNPFAMRRVDLLGVGDLLALNGEEILLVQVTDSTNGDAHKKKIQTSEKLPLWISAGGKLVMHLWKKHEKSNRWHVSEHTYEEIMAGTRKKYSVPKN